MSKKSKPAAAKKQTESGNAPQGRHAVKAAPIPKRERKSTKALPTPRPSGGEPATTPDGKVLKVPHNDIDNVVNPERKNFEPKTAQRGENTVGGHGTKFPPGTTPF